MNGLPQREMTQEELDLLKKSNQEQDTFDDIFEEVSKQFETTEEELKELMEDE